MALAVLAELSLGAHDARAIHLAALEPLRERAHEHAADAREERNDQNSNNEETDKSKPTANALHFFYSGNILVAQQQ